MMTWGKHWWVTFLLVSSIWISAGFGIPEIWALLTDSKHVDNTLSFYARTELNVTAQLTVHTVAWWITQILYIILFFVLLIHIWYDQLG